MDTLQEGIMILESSSDIMSYLIQDLLDYGQIKAGKFRKNMTTFNLKNAMEKCIRIQKKKAESKGIRLFSELVPLLNDEFKIHTDE